MISLPMILREREQYTATLGFSFILQIIYNTPLKFMPIVEKTWTRSLLIIC